ncbi:MAG TPA: hypothetical protein IAA60_08040 [Candidatus Ornithomonoglobus intestinigallinarum]|uniref:3-keto-disaccharide hydrolase domain-containing protein n=1 Tax=Candidatus Ornithomonoglobus intestinigallinarum TaxID=2840894 RepID=A0A9D1H3A6_9FIRM|nr:hypothetical protein [Candidatus Ornithomonoglobus intestinigallinarum]
MKKIFNKALSLAAASAMVISAMTAVPASAESTLIYGNAFDTASSLNDLTLVNSSVLEGKPDMTFSEEKGSMYFEAWGQNTAFLLPEEVTAADFVMEADVIYEKKPGTEQEGGYRGGSIGYGFIFGCQDENNFSDIVYYPLNGNVIMHNTINGTMKGRNAEKGNGASVTFDENESAHLKLIVNDGLMEFFVNDELCYTYYSDSENAPFRNFTEGGRLGLYSNADKTYLTYKDLIIRTVDESDVAYYSDAFMDNKTKFNDNLSPLSDFHASYFKETPLNDGAWGNLKYGSSAYTQQGRYFKMPLEGNYVVDMNFAFDNPLNASRYIGFMIGGKEEADGSFTYTNAAVKPNGQMAIEQKTVTTAAENPESTIGGSEAAYNDCRDTISSDKINPDVDTSAAEVDQYFISYMPEGYKSEDNADVNPRRHDLHMEVVDGQISITFEGTTLRLTPDVNTTDGYFGIRSSGTAARIYSLRIAPYSEGVDIEIPETTMTCEYSEITTDYATAEILVTDGKNLTDEDTRVIFAVYDANGALAGVQIEKMSDTTIIFDMDLSLESTEGASSKVMLWNMRTMQPIIDALPIEV